MIDTSAAVDALASGTPSAGLVDRLRDDGDLHAPHLIDVEFLQAVRRLESGGLVSADRADDIRRDFYDLPIVRYPHHPLAERIWQMRRNITAYDAAFVALAEALGAPLVTCDSRLAAAPGTGVKVDLYPPG